MYGGCAVLIRDVTWRAGRGWPTMPILGTACTLIEEGLVTQSLFNHQYPKMHMDLLDAAYIPALGIRGWWTLFMFNPRTLWSMGVSIASEEALFPGEAEARWLGQAARAPFQARISDIAEEMEVVEHHRRQASLEYVSRSTLASVDKVCVAPVSFTDCAAKGVKCPGFRIR